MIKYLIFISILMSSCSRENTIKTIYSYNGVTITRIEKDRISDFYYGNTQGDESDTTLPHIRVEYPLGTDIMEGYLLFKKGNKVILVSMTSNFFQKTPDSLFRTFRFKSNVNFIDWEDSVKHKFTNLVRISESSRLEDSFNKEFGSQVHIERFSME